MIKRIVLENNSLFRRTLVFYCKITCNAMEETQLLKIYLSISKDIKKRFTTQKTISNYCHQLDGIIKLLEKDNNIECMSMFSHLKGKCEEDLSKKKSQSDTYLKSGRRLFEKCLDDISKGHSITFEEYTDAMYNYENTLKCMSKKDSYLSGCYTFEMATYLRKLVKLTEAAEQYRKAADYFSNYHDLHVISQWQAICCIIYTNEFSQVKYMIEQFSKLTLEDFYVIARDSKIIMIFINVILNSCATDIIRLFQIMPNSSKHMDQEVYVDSLIKGICVSYIEGNLESFRELENLLLPYVSLEQQYILNEMRFRCENQQHKLTI